MGLSHADNQTVAKFGVQEKSVPGRVLAAQGVSVLGVVPDGGRCDTAPPWHHEPESAVAQTGVGIVCVDSARTLRAVLSRRRVRSAIGRNRRRRLPRRPRVGRQPAGVRSQYRPTMV